MLKIKLNMLYILVLKIVYWIYNTLRPKQNGRHFAEDILKGIFLKDNVRP